MHNKSIFLNLQLLIFMVPCISVAECWSAEDTEYDLQYKLIKNLKSRTNPNMMPFTGKAVNVTFGVSLHQIIDVVRICLTLRKHFFGKIKIWIGESGIYGTLGFKEHKMFSFFEFFHICLFKSATSFAGKSKW